MLGARTVESTQTMNIMTKFMENRPKTAGKVFAARINAHGARIQRKIYLTQFVWSQNVHSLATHLLFSSSEFILFVVRTCVRFAVCCLSLHLILLLSFHWHLFVIVRWVFLYYSFAFNCPFGQGTIWTQNLTSEFLLYKGHFFHNSTLMLGQIRFLNKISLWELQYSSNHFWYCFFFVLPKITFCRHDTFH